MNKRSHGEGSLTKRDNGTFLARCPSKAAGIQDLQTPQGRQEWINTINGQCGRVDLQQR